MLTGNAEEVGATLLLAVIYLIAVRVLDLNEREPWWSLVLLFILGAAAAATLHVLVSPLTLELDLVAGAAWREAAAFVAIAAGVWMLSEVGRMRGWSEVTDLVDGLVYGMAAGFGFVVGEALARAMDALPVTPIGGGPTAPALAQIALAGLSQGVFGAIIGAGFGLAVSRRTRLRFVWPVVALLVAIAVHAGHSTLAYGNALGQSSAVVRGWLALLLPLLAIVALAIYELAAERRVIVRELSEEIADGYLTERELQTLQSPWRRQLESLGTLLTGRLGRARLIAALHNRRVMLALAKQRARRGGSDAVRRQAQAEVDALRRNIRELSEALDRSSSPRRSHGAAS